MSTVFIIIIGALVGFIIAILFLYQRKQVKKDNGGGLQLILQQINELTRTVDKKLGEQSRQMHDSLKHQSTQSVQIIKDITERLTRLDETNKQVVSFADQLQSLQDILKNPKQRGILGEYYLETLLKNVMPPGGFKMQYAFKDGTIVDAVVFVKDKIIPIDSKFSLENYNRLAEEKNKTERERLEREFKNDLKRRIDETSKYIKPDEGTMDFAFMFIPHEAIYYDLLISQVGSVTVDTRDLIEYAFKDRHVVIVSPTSFLAFLQTVLQGLKALQIEEGSKEIQKQIEKLVTHLKRYDEYMIKLGTTLGTTVSHYNTAHHELKKIDKDVTRITGTSPEIEPLTLEKPNVE